MTRIVLLALTLSGAARASTSFADAAPRIPDLRAGAFTVPDRFMDAARTLVEIHPPAPAATPSAGPAHRVRVVPSWNAPAAQ